MNDNAAHNAVILAVLYVLLIAYASLFPFSGWHLPANPFAWLFGPLPRSISRKDALVNLLAYIPFGFIVCWRCLSAANRHVALPISLLAGFCLSLVMEMLQTFLHPREPSLVDLITNSSGTAVGSVLALFYSAATVTGGTLRRWGEDWLEAGSNSRIGAGILLLWGLARLSPFVPARSWPVHLPEVCPLWLTLHGRLPFHPADALVHCCTAAGLTLLAAAILQPGVRLFRLSVAVAALILTARFFIVSGYLTLEELLGYAAGIGVAVLLSRLPHDFPLFAAMTAIVAGYVLSEVTPGRTAAISGHFNWIPFRYHLDNTLAAIGLILEAIWPLSALSLLWTKLKGGSGTGGMIYGGMAVFLTVTLLEWQQQYLPGRTADITQALLALIGWSLPFGFQDKST